MTTQSIQQRNGLGPTSRWVNARLGAARDRSAARQFSTRATRGFVGCLVTIAGAALVACSGSSHSGSSAGRLAAPGVELPASQIPWNQVGDGWILATWSQASDASGGPSKGAVTLYLFDPAGGRYAITSLPPEPGNDGQTPVLASWSGDARHALFQDIWDRDGNTRMIEVDVATGAKHTLTAQRRVSAAYSRPTGQAILLSGTKPITPGAGPSNANANTLERVDLNGNKQLTLPTDQLGSAGKFNGDFLQTPDGSQLVLGTDNGMVVVSNNGVIARQLPMPAPTTSCRPVRWWNPTVILAACVPPRNVDMGMQLWQVPLAGGSPTRLVAPTEESLGYLNAWQIPSGTFLENVPGCGGDGLLFRLTTGMQTTQVIVPGVDRDKTVRVVGVTGDKLLLKTTGGCGSHAMVLRIYDPAANTATVLPSPPGSGSVRRAILYPNV